MELDELLERLQPWFNRNSRPAWRPVTEPGESPLILSKFSGTPWLPSGEEWPRCRNCGEPIAMFLQLDLDELPEELGQPFGSGLIQFFYCINLKSGCEQTSDSWSPFSKAHLIRIVQPDRPGRTDLTPLFESTLPSRTITGWDRFDDKPGFEEYEENGLTIEHEQGSDDTQHLKVDCPELGLSEISLAPLPSDDDPFDRCSPGDKLAGWPHWIQSPEYPDCPECGLRMQLLFQIDSGQNLDYMFGDTGCGHITQCPSHPNVLAFGWACC